MNYIGSKRRLLTQIQSILTDHEIPTTGTALDLFSGTGTVSQLLKSMGYQVYANDWQYYAYILTAAHIKIHSYPLFRKLCDTYHLSLTSPITIPTQSQHGRSQLSTSEPFAAVLQHLNSLPGKDGRFTDEYCENGKKNRNYFTHENGKKIQAIRDQIEDWFLNNIISLEEKIWLIGCLIESVDRIANTAAVYSAYLKKIKPVARTPLTLVALPPTASNRPGIISCCDCLDILDQLPKMALTYIDPPYNVRQYSVNYHLLETIAKWDLDQFQPRITTGLRQKSELNSLFCMPKQVNAAFSKLIQKLNTQFVLLSYNNEGLLDKDRLLEYLTSKYSIMSFKEIDYRRFKADSNSQNRIYKKSPIKEYLILGKSKT